MAGSKPRARQMAPLSETPQSVPTNNQIASTSKAHARDKTMVRIDVLYGVMYFYHCGSDSNLMCYGCVFISWCLGKERIWYTCGRGDWKYIHEGMQLCISNVFFSLYLRYVMTLIYI